MLFTFDLESDRRERERDREREFDRDCERERDRRDLDLERDFNLWPSVSAFRKPRSSIATNKNNRMRKVQNFDFWKRKEFAIVYSRDYNHRKLNIYYDKKKKQQQNYNGTVRDSTYRRRANGWIKRH